ncbi:hypothetical protein PF008_g27574 [Phytophthora fragariae]|uniref:Aquaporin n=1 Tax=Phytophthora fragariae TaxID=53985 RepID=A0A6G0QDT9_9STRA|nr:hypothetical protein PF008_g27574 [Phytophthora fragariae]
MNTVPLHPSASRVHVSEDGFANSGQFVIDMTDKSAYADFATTPYTPHVQCRIDPDPSLHETNRSQLWEHGQDLKRLPFVTTRLHLRECMAEFLGAVIVIGFGLAVNSQVAISDGKAGDVMTVSLAWGVAVLMGVYTAENVSGAHIISVITFTHAVYGRMPWWKVPGYMLAQTFGAFVAAALVYVLHYEKISAGDLKTMHFLFVTYPHDVSNYSAFYTEVLLCAFLMSCVYAITDQRNRCPGPVGTPFALALLVMALGAGFSLNTGLGASVNRDLGPRCFAYLAGYKEAFTEYSYYFWIPIVGPFLGGVVGAGAYILFVEIQHPVISAEPSVSHTV